MHTAYTTAGAFPVLVIKSSVVFASETARISYINSVQIAAQEPPNTADEELSI
jgi:hypothetical protein